MGTGQQVLKDPQRGHQQELDRAWSLEPAQDGQPRSCHDIPLHSDFSIAQKTKNAHTYSCVQSNFTVVQITLRILLMILKFMLQQSPPFIQANVDMSCLSFLQGTLLHLWFRSGSGLQGICHPRPTPVLALALGTPVVSLLLVCDPGQASPDHRQVQGLRLWVQIRTQESNRNKMQTLAQLWQLSPRSHNCWPGGICPGWPRPALIRGRASWPPDTAHLFLDG